MRRRITEILLYCLLLSLVFGGISVQAEENRKESAEGRSLFISSYNYGWDTVQSQIEGIQAGVSDEAVVDYEFMDTKRVSDETSEQLFYEGLKYRLSKVAPYDVIILGDDAALLFAQKYREELFAEIPLVYEGVNNEQLAYEMSEDPLITGVIEKLSVEKNIVFAKTLLPDAKKVVAILDDSVTGRTIREQFFACEEKFPELTFSEINASEGEDQTAWKGNNTDLYLHDGRRKWKAVFKQGGSKTDHRSGHGSGIPDDGRGDRGRTSWWQCCFHEKIRRRSCRHGNGYHQWEEQR